jgi:hypothetical protein
LYFRALEDHNSSTRWTPFAFSSRNWCAMNGSQFTSNSDLGTFSIAGRNLVANPPRKYRHWQHFYFSSSAFLCELCVSGLSSPTAQLVFGAAVQIFVAIRTQGNQISQRVVPEPTTGDYLVDMQIVSPAKELAPPPVSFEHLIVKRLILGPRELQRLYFAMNFTHEFPWAPDGFRRL